MQISNKIKIQYLPNLSIFLNFSYKVTPETGYVAEVRYEGVVAPLAPVAQSERLQQRPQGQGRRPAQSQRAGKALPNGLQGA